MPQILLGLTHVFVEQSQFLADSLEAIEVRQTSFERQYDRGPGLRPVGPVVSNAGVDSYEQPPGFSPSFVFQPPVSEESHFSPIGDGSKPWYPCSSHQNSWDLWMFIPAKNAINRYWSIPIFTNSPNQPCFTNRFLSDLVWQGLLKIPQSVGLTGLKAKALRRSLRWGKLWCRDQNCFFLQAMVWGKRAIIDSYW